MALRRRLRICHLLIPDELRNGISASETLGQLPTRRRKAAQTGGERAPQFTRASEIGPMIGSDNNDLVSDLLADMCDLIVRTIALTPPDRAGARRHACAFVLEEITDSVARLATSYRTH